MDSLHCNKGLRSLCSLCEAGHTWDSIWSMYRELVLAICDLSLVLRLAVYGQLYTYSHWSSFQINQM